MNINLIPDEKYAPPCHNSRVICYQGKLLLVFNSSSDGRGMLICFDDVRYISRTRFHDWDSYGNGVLYEQTKSKLLESLIANEPEKYNGFKHYVTTVFLEHKLDIVAKSFVIKNHDFLVF